eukprot:2150807-Rhodomonas_salina.5
MLYCHSVCCYDMCVTDLAFDPTRRVRSVTGKWMVPHTLPLHHTLALYRTFHTDRAAIRYLSTGKWMVPRHAMSVCYYACTDVGYATTHALCDFQY